jgi:transposase InsO family protein
MISHPNRCKAVELINIAVTSGASRPGACACLGIDPRTFQRWRQDGTVKPDARPDAARPVPQNKLSDAERTKILITCNSAPYQSLPPSQIVPALADLGQYLASESSFYRILKQANQQQHRGKAAAPKVVRKPKACKATAANQVWSWDITYLASTVRGQFYRLYLIMDIFSRKIVGWEIHLDETAEHASVLIKKACLAEGAHHASLILHSDNGSPMKGATMLATLQKLGVIPSFSRPSVSDDNAYSESLFRTLKYTPAYPAKPFLSLTAARQWVDDFVSWYNQEHHHSGIQFVTPADRHSGKDKQVLQRRTAVYCQAKTRHPERWSGGIRNWKYVDVVWLNPDAETPEKQLLLKRAS